MSYRLAHDALNAPNCNGVAKLVLIALADYANEKTGNCYPSHGTIAKTIGHSRRAVVSAINELEKLGYVRRSEKHGLACSYILNIPQDSSKWANSLCEDFSQGEEGQDVKIFHRGYENASQEGVKKFHTNREDINREKEKRIETEDTSAGKENKEKRSTTAAEDASVVSFPSFPSSQQKPPVDLSLEAVQAATIDRLCENGSVPDRARRGVEENVSLYEIKFERLQKTGELAKKNDPFRYLVASYAGIVEDWFKKDRTLEEVLADMRIEMGHVYPEHRALLARILTPDALPRAVGESLRIKAEIDWFGVTDPYTYTFKALANWVAREVEEEEARQVEAEEAALAERVA